MQSAIQALIEANPTPAVVSLPVSSSEAYVPATTYGLPTAETAQDEVNCLFGLVTDTGLADQYQASATFDVDQFSSEAQAGDCRVTIADITYTVDRVRKRFYGGVQTGWTLLLKQ